MSCDKYSVLYTHQKTKKAKTWQDGFLRVTGSKAVLCDEVSKTLDSFFVRKDQTGGALASWLVRSFPKRVVQVQALAGDTVLGKTLKSHGASLRPGI